MRKTILFLILILAGCPAKEDAPAKAAPAATAATSKPVAKPSEPEVAKPTMVAKPMGGGEMIPILPSSKIEFTGTKIIGKHDGGFTRFSGAIVLTGDDPAKSVVTVEIDMTSVFSDSDGLTDHLKTDDFFAIEKHPNATYVSRRISPLGGNKFEVQGLLTLRGVTKPQTFSATIDVTEDSVKAVGEMKIMRRDFGIVYPGKPDNLINNEVTIRMTIEGKRG